MGKTFKNKPLIETIFELRWTLREQAPQVFTDANYSLLIGRLYERLSSTYSHYEQLPSAEIPEQLAAYVVQHRFRVGPGMWPLVQIGPGVLTINDTVNYTWTDFRSRITNVVEAFFQAYPQPSKLVVEGVQLRYIDGISFDFSEDVLEFLAKDMKLKVSLQEQFFKGTGVNRIPLSADIKLTYQSDAPKGIISMQFARGQNNSEEALIWETILQSARTDAPQNSSEIKEWAEAAHEVIRDWFFKVIEGDLERRFE